MKRRARLAALLAATFFLLQAAAGDAALPASSDAAAAGAETEDPSRQVLVMLRMPPDHYRAEAAYGGGYGGGAGHAARRRIAGELARDNGLTLVADWAMPAVGLDCYVMAVPANATTAHLALRLARDERVASALPVNVYHAQSAAEAARGDPLYAVQPAAREWHLDRVHRLATGRGIRVAVINSGVDADHPDLAGQVFDAENLMPAHGNPPEAHGTAVAAIIAARAKDGLGIAGVAPDSRLLALRVCWQPAAEPLVCTTFSLAMALHRAITQRVQVISMSHSGPTDLLLGELIDAALTRGIAVVGAVDRSLPGGGFPASHAGVVAVAVVDEDPGASLVAGALLAPGHDVPTAQPGGRWGFVSGSSYAAAHVSGLAALLGELGATLGAGTFQRVVSKAGGVDACATLPAALPANRAAERTTPHPLGTSRKEDVRASGPCACGCAEPRNAGFVNAPCRFDYVEAQAGLIDSDWNARVYLSPDYFGTRDRTAYLEFNGGIPLAAASRLVAHGGAFAYLGRHADDGDRSARFDARFGVDFASEALDLQLAWVGVDDRPAPDGKRQSGGLQRLLRILRGRTRGRDVEPARRPREEGGTGRMPVNAGTVRRAVRLP